MLKSSITNCFRPHALSFTATGDFHCFAVSVSLQFISRSLPLNIIILLRQFWVLFSKYFRSVKQLWYLWISNLLLFLLQFYNSFPNSTNFRDLDVGSDQVKTLHYIWRRPPYGTRRQKAFQSCKFRSPCISPQFPVISSELSLSPINLLSSPVNFLSSPINYLSSPISLYITWWEWKF